VPPKIQSQVVLGDQSHSRLSLTPFLALLVLPIAIGVAAYHFGIPLEPDASYYVGGLSLFPSPLGTLLGTAGGYTGLALLNAFAAFAIIVLVGLIARDLGGHAVLAQILALVIARGEWFTSWGMDSPAVALLLAAALLHLRGRSRWAIVLIGLAAATHLAALPLALGVLAMHARRRGVVAVVIGLAAAGTFVASFTGYRAGFRILHEPSSLIEGAHELLLACWPLAILACVATFHPRVRLLFIGSALGAILAGAIPASVGQVGLTRYAVPCVFIAVAGVRLRGSLAAEAGTAPRIIGGHRPQFRSRSSRSSTS
jgi:hypothetical protein